MHENTVIDFRCSFLFPGLDVFGCLVVALRELGNNECVIAVCDVINRDREYWISPRPGLPCLLNEEEIQSETLLSHGEFIIVLIIERIIMTSSNGNIFRVTGPLCGEFTGPGEFPSQRPVTRSFDVFFDQRMYKREAGDLRRHRGLYDVIVMWRLESPTTPPFAPAMMYQHGLGYMVVLSRKWRTLTHRGRDKMATVSQTTLSNAFFEWKC